MTTWVLAILIFALLATPGLAVSGMDPESMDLTKDHVHEGEWPWQELTQKDLQDDMLIEGWQVGITCSPCKKIIQKLKDMVGDDPTDDSINQALSPLCNKLKPLKSLCTKIVKKYVKPIAKDLAAGKSASDVCVDIKMCKPSEESVWKLDR
ncbi:granulysin [Suncus etruscus]|uniref:granulysin n=1 Tax=Suncus etruscus TaxID=109475 RepID=UPI002110402A|nr:granulysin [Suncus etruscus]